MRKIKNLIIAASIVATVAGVPVLAAGNMNGMGSMGTAPNGNTGSQPMTMQSGKEQSMTMTVTVTDEDSKFARSKTVELLTKLALSQDAAMKLSSIVEKYQDKAQPLETAITTLNEQLTKLKADMKTPKAVLDATSKQLTLKQAQLNAALNSVKLELKGIVDVKTSAVLGILIYGDNPVSTDPTMKSLIQAANEIKGTKAAIGHGPRVVLDHSLMDYMGADAEMNRQMGGTMTH